MLSVDDELKRAIMQCAEWLQGTVQKSSDVRAWLVGVFRKHDIMDVASKVLETMDSLEHVGFLRSERQDKRAKGHKVKKFGKVGYADVIADEVSRKEMERLELGRDDFH
eukprot:8779745-Karenia_brevis.AAC.1